MDSPVSRNGVKAISELLAFMFLVTVMAFVAPASLLFAFVVNSIAGSVITDLSKAYVPLTEKIQNNQISIAWGLGKMLRNNFWWR